MKLILFPQIFKGRAFLSLESFCIGCKIEDYLYYKGMSICEETINRYKEGDTIGKSDYTDWHDTDSSTDR